LTQFLAFAVLLAVVACADSAGPPQGDTQTPPTPPSIRLSGSFPDTLRQPGHEFVVLVTSATKLAEVYVLIDSGTFGQRRVSVDTAGHRGAPPFTDKPVTVLIRPTLANGVHEFRLRVRDVNNAVAETTWTRRVYVPEVAYTVQVIEPPAGDTRDYRPTDINAHGQVVGYSSSGGARAFTWTNGTFTSLGDSGSSVARAVADGGQVFGSDGGAAVVWSGGAKSVLRNGVALESFNHGRMVLVRDQSQAYLMDRETGASNTLMLLYVAIRGGELIANNAGRYATVGNVSLYGCGIETTNFSARLPALRPGTGDHYGRGSWRGPTAIDDQDQLLGQQEGESFLATAVHAYYLTQFLPGTARDIAPNGELLSISGESVFLWNADGTRRVVFQSSEWRVSGETPAGGSERWAVLNSAGQIALTGVHTTTGRRLPLLLTPTAQANQQRP
jgi:probable HAF family extracellular repeat protein